MVNSDMDTQMTKQNASELLAEALSIGNSINRMMEIISDVDPSDSKERFVESIGLITGYNADVIMGIRKLYPDLHPMFDDLK